MVYRYGIYQSSPKSCVFYKQDEDGNQSTFNLFVTPDKTKQKSVSAFIDNEGMKKENWSKKISDVRDIIDAFGGWASDAPLMFEIEAEKSMSECLGSVLKKEESEE